MNAPTLIRDDWVARITACWRTSLDAILQVGRLLADAKAALPHGEFGGMIESDLPFGARTAQMLMKIADDPRITNPKHASLLPPSWATLHELTKLTDDQFERGVVEKTIRPDMERREVINGARSIMGSRQEPDDSLDYFPTPPWATRALIERVLCGHWNIPRDSLTNVWEPACGEGHMAEVFAEYFGRVWATDIHDYGYGTSDYDFINRAPNPPDAIDWIATNPPFGDLAEAFVLRALDLARVGVAMFFRLQWLETVGRYNNIFKPHPPALIAQFSERVPLCKGRWNPAGDTATAYLWLVWLKAERSGKTEFIWISPGQREALTHDDDAERFTAHPVIKRIVPKDSNGSPIPHNENGEVTEVDSHSRESHRDPVTSGHRGGVRDDEFRCSDFRNLRRLRFVADRAQYQECALSAPHASLSNM